MITWQSIKDTIRTPATSPDQTYKAFRVEEQLISTLKNSSTKHIKKAIDKDISGRVQKRKMIDKTYNNYHLTTRSDRDIWAHFSSRWVQCNEWKIDIFACIDWKFWTTVKDTISPQDLLGITSPMWRKMETSNLEIIPIKILWKMVWQIGITLKNGYKYTFFTCLSEDNQKIEIIANQEWFLSGDYSDMIDAYTSGWPFHVTLAPFTGKTSSIKNYPNVFVPDEPREVDFKEFLSPNI